MTTTKTELEILLAGLDTFTSQYIETALWSSTDESNESGGEPMDANYGAEDIALETLKEMVADCEDFQTSFGELISEDLSQAGHDFWLTRNGHGAGFWDGDWDSPLPDSVETAKPYETVGDYLTDMSEPYGEVNLYVGDDGKIYS